MDIINALKSLPFTLEVEQDKDGVFIEVKEFSPAYSDEKTLDESLRSLAHNMKEWGSISSANIDQWKKGREQEVPYLLKILVSSEEELLECLRNSKCESI